MSVLKIQTVDKLTVKVYSTRDEMGRAAAAEAAAAIKAAIAEKGEINMIFAAAPSQNQPGVSPLTKEASSLAWVIMARSWGYRWSPLRAAFV